MHYHSLRLCTDTQRPVQQLIKTWFIMYLLQLRLVLVLYGAHSLGWISHEVRAHQRTLFACIRCSLKKENVFEVINLAKLQNVILRKSTQRINKPWKCGQFLHINLSLEINFRQDTISLGQVEYQRKWVMANTNRVNVQDYF